MVKGRPHENPYLLIFQLTKGGILIMVVILQVSTTKVWRWQTLKQNSEYGQNFVDGRLRYTTMKMEKILWMTDFKLSNGKQNFVDGQTPNFQNGKQTTKFWRWQTQIHNALACWSTHNNVKILGSIFVIHWLYNGDTICRGNQPLLAKSLGKWWNCQVDKEC